MAAAVMMDRRSLLKRLGLAGLAIPAAMLIEPKLIMPEAERAKAAEAIARPIKEWDASQSFEMQINREANLFRANPQAAPIFTEARITARWTCAETDLYQVGDTVRISRAGVSAIVYVTSVRHRWRFDEVTSEYEAEGLWA